MVCFFLSLLKQKLSQRFPKQGGGGVKATSVKCPKGSSFFQDDFPKRKVKKHDFYQHFVDNVRGGGYQVMFFFYIIIKC